MHRPVEGRAPTGGVGPHSVVKTMGMLQRVFRDAVEAGEASFNPVKAFRKPSPGPTREVQPFTPVQIEALAMDELAGRDKVTGLPPRDEQGRVAVRSARRGAERARNDRRRSYGVQGPASERLRDVVRRSVEVLVADQDAVTLLLRVRGNSETEIAALRRRRSIDRRLGTGGVTKSTSIREVIV